MNALSFWYIGLAVGMIAVGITIFIVFFTIFTRRSKMYDNEAQVDSETELQQGIDLLALDPKKPSPRGPRLKLFGIDQRLVVFVLAPRGRGVELPETDALRQVVERIGPGFATILDTHQPVFRRWSPQMSFEGFTHSFGHQLQLPGEKGIGTPWSSVVGRISVPGGQLFVGLICFSAEENATGQCIIEHQGKWTDMLRVV